MSEKGNRAAGGESTAIIITFRTSKVQPQSSLLPMRTWQIDMFMAWTRTRCMFHNAITVDAHGILILAYLLNAHWFLSSQTCES